MERARSALSMKSHSTIIKKISVLRIRIRFLCFPDPDSLVRMDPAHHAKIVRKTLISPVL
jgi:hypothetical protein